MNAGIDSADLARRWGRSEEHLVEVERGDVRPSGAQLFHLSRLLECDLSDFFIPSDR